MPQYYENDLGVHVEDPGQCDQTLCGFAFDATGDDEIEGGSLRPTKKTTVTCHLCVRVINFCKTQRTRGAHQ